MAERRWNRRRGRPGSLRAAVLVVVLLLVLEWKATAAARAAATTAGKGPAEGEGRRAPQRRHAYAAMMYMGTPRDYEFYVATRVMLKSLAKLKADADLVVIASADVPARWQRALKEEDGVKVVTVENVRNPYEGQGNFNRRFKLTLNKLYAWSLAEYDRVVMLDSDNIFLQRTDELFQCGQFCAVFINPCIFHTGLFVLQPSMEVFKNMLHELEIGRENPDGADQGFLASYFPDLLDRPMFHPPENGSKLDGTYRLPLGYQMDASYYYMPRGVIRGRGRRPPVPRAPPAPASSGIRHPLPPARDSSAPVPPAPTSSAPAPAPAPLMPPAPASSGIRPPLPPARDSSAPVPPTPTSSAPLVPAVPASSGPASDGGSNIDSQPHGLPCWISGNKIEPDGAVRFTTSLVQAHIPGPLESFRLFPIGVRDVLFEMFLNKYKFVRAEDQGRCRSVWEATAQTNYRKSLYEARAKAKKATGSEESQTWKEHNPSWIKKEDWEALCNKWTDPGWRNKSNKGKANREAQPQKNLHTGGSLSFAAHKEKMTQQFQHEIPFRDLFEKTHKRKGADGEDTQYVSDRAREVAAEYDRFMIEKYGEGTQHPELDPAAWVAAAGSANKGRVYGFGQSLDATAVASSFSSTGRAPPCTSSTFRTSVDASQPPSDFMSYVDGAMSRLRQEIRQDVKSDMVHVLTEFMTRMSGHQGESSSTAPAQDPSQSEDRAGDDAVADLGADDDAPI